jgi:hypothetical protein
VLQATRQDTLQQGTPASTSLFVSLLSIARKVLWKDHAAQHCKVQFYTRKYENVH